MQPHWHCMRLRLACSFHSTQLSHWNLESKLTLNHPVYSNLFRSAPSFQRHLPLPQTKLTTEALFNYLILSLHVSVEALRRYPLFPSLVGDQATFFFLFISRKRRIRIKGRKKGDNCHSFFADQTKGRNSRTNRSKHILTMALRGSDKYVSLYTHCHSFSTMEQQKCQYKKILMSLSIVLSCTKSHCSISLKVTGIYFLSHACLALLSAFHF